MNGYLYKIGFLVLNNCCFSICFEKLSDNETSGSIAKFKIYKVEEIERKNNISRISTCSYLV